MDKVGKPEIVENLEQYWTENVERHGWSSKSLDWGSWASMNKRFEILCKILPDHSPETPPSILDVGCGLGNLIDYLSMYYDYPGSYTGIDISTKMVKAAQEHYTNSMPSRNPVNFKVHDMAEPLEEKYDYVIMSGVLTKRIGTSSEQRHWASLLLDNCWKATKKAMAFNMLSTFADKGHVAPLDFKYDPADVLSHCMWFLSRNVTLDHTYMPHDFTITVQREIK